MTAFSVRGNCPVCGGTDHKILLDRPYSDPNLRRALTQFYERVGGLDYAAIEEARYVVAECRECHMVFQRVVPEDRILARLYEEWIDPEKARRLLHAEGAAEVDPRLTREVRLAAALVPADAPARWLDYGCGWGEWSRHATKLGVETWGTELSPSRRAHAVGIGIRIAEDSSLPEKAFGLINLDQVLEHVPSPRTTLALLTRLVHPRGLVRIGVPNGWRIRRALHRFDHELSRPRLGGLNPIAPLEHLNCFTTTSLVLLARRCGLRRVVPPWTVLRNITPIGSDWRARIKSAAYPFYLRSSIATQLFFRTEAGRPEP